MRDFFLLQQEACLAQACVCNGLNCMSKGNLGKQGEFFMGFFGLSIGLERVAKLSVILSHFLENNFTFPDDGDLKKFSHDLLKLHVTIYTVASARFPQQVNPIDPTSFDYKILQFLSDFARITRYYNLNVLSGKNLGANPLEAWYLIVKECMEKDATKADLAKIAVMFDIGKSVEKLSSGISSGMGETMITVPEQFLQSALIDCSAKHVQARVLNIIKAFVNVLNLFSKECHRVIQEQNLRIMMPFFDEFFTFLNLSEKDLKRKKRWP